MKGSYSVILTFVVFSLLGLLALPKIPVRFSKSSWEKRIVVSYHWPHAAPQALERQVTAPLEGVMGTIQGVKGITSSSDYQEGMIVLSLDEKADIDKMRLEAASLVRQVYRSLPQGVSYPAISLNSLADDERAKPLLSLQLNGNEAPGQLRKYIEASLKPQFARLEGIRAVEVHGGEPEEWLLEYQPDVILSLGIKEEDIRAAVAKNGLLSSLGWMSTSDGLKQSISLASGILDFGNILVAKKGDRIIRLSDIATIRKQEKRAEGYFRINGKSAVQIALMPLANVNQLRVASEVKKTLRKIGSELPPGYGIRIDYDATEYIYESLDLLSKQVIMALVAIMAMVGIVFRSLKLSLLVVAGLVTCMLLAALALYVLGIVVYVPSLATIIISMGVVSGCILLTFTHFLQRRNRLIIISIFGSTLILGVALSVIWLLPDEIRADLTDFVVILMVVQCMSLSVCLWLIPALLQQLNIQDQNKKILQKGLLVIVGNLYGVILAFLCRFRRTAIIFCILLFGLPLFLLPQRLDEESRYSAIYNDTIGNDWYVENVRPYLDKGLGGFLRLFSNYVYDKSYYGSREQTALYINAGLPNHSTIEQMDAVLKRMEGELGRHSEIDRFISRVYNGQQGTIIIYFKKQYNDGSFPYQMKGKAIAMSTEMSGIDWDIYGVGQGFNVNVNENGTPTFNVALKGYNYKELEEKAIVLQKRLLAHPRIQEVDINKVPGFFRQKDLYAYKINTDPVYWSHYDASMHSLYGAIEKYNARPQPDLYQLVGDTYTGINIVPLSLSRFDVTALRNEPLAVSDRIRLKTGDHADLVKEKIIPSIRKEDQQYLRQVSFEYMGSANFGGKFLDKTLKVFQQELPMGYTAERKLFGWWQLNGRRQYELIGLSMLLIFVISAIMFESLRQPFTLIASVTLSFVGLFAAFYTLDIGFDQGGYASFLLLIGLTSVPIVMVMNEYNSLLKAGAYSNVETYQKAIIGKFKPVLYFILSVLVSLTPFLWYSSDMAFWYSLAIGTFGGIAASLLVVLFFVPMLLLS
ncbi:efflux RND transporter permease subunit [Dyadobacter tibetensis]|uniref:efflux RND transporter permease subunit n=1 Tax=Dyadobacter tibetensis TaxID=1211851 RepID=UPI0004705117|nr:efflux RND transporter permease subunit [Dyadobacter tibetensis]